MKCFSYSFKVVRLFSVLFVLTLLVACSAKKQAPERKLHQTEYGWTMTLPPGFDSVPPKDWERLQNRGREAVEQTFDTTIENRARMLYIFQSGQYNYFEAIVQPADYTKGKLYRESFKGVNDLLFEALETQMPGVRLDSTYDEEIVGGLRFLRFDINVHLPQMKLQMIMFSQLFGNEEVSVNITCADPKKLATLLEAWRSSTFSKETTDLPSALRELM